MSSRQTSNSAASGPHSHCPETGGLFAAVERAAAAANRTGAVGLPPLADALRDYIDGLATENPALTHPHAVPATQTFANALSSYFGARLRHTSDKAKCDLPLLRMSVAAPPDPDLGTPSIHDWLEAFEATLVSRSGTCDHYLRSQFYLMYHPRLWTPDDPEPTRVPLAYATVLAALVQRARWPRNKQVKATVAELLPPALERLDQAPDDTPRTPAVRIVRRLAAGADPTPEFAAALDDAPRRRPIAWDLLALAALAHDLKRPAAVEDTRLPTTLVTGK
ncbi:hypothetical protein [Nocardia blacklockiae]|uniref:hypothetical protein n=1 Tax=Nocardia blacklockiae TaxID=480036 RepID=UPI001893EA8D|nr:hypothetical protein [Nocardia blacklockiae]MBF6176256.1 hypothetical protein [Nocardia blacklockiae]